MNGFPTNHNTYGKFATFNIETQLECNSNEWGYHEIELYDQNLVAIVGLIVVVVAIWREGGGGVCDHLKRKSSLWFPIILAPELYFWNLKKKFVEFIAIANQMRECMIWFNNLNF